MQAFVSGFRRVVNPRWRRAPRKVWPWLLGASVAVCTGEPERGFSMKNASSEQITEAKHEMCAQWASDTVVEWGGVSASALKVRPLSGGLTNLLFVVSRPDTPDQSNGPASVLVRVYGGGAEDSFVDRNKEGLVAETLGRMGSGPRVFGFFSSDGSPGLINECFGTDAGRVSGRVEQFLEGSRPLRTKELWAGHVPSEIARQLALLNERGMDGCDEDPQYPWLTRMLHAWYDESLGIVEAARARSIAPGDDQIHEGQLRGVARDIIEDMLAGIYDHRGFAQYARRSLTDVDQASDQQLAERLAQHVLKALPMALLQRECAQTINGLAALDGEWGDQCFCHNDSQENNILVLQDGALQLIDFEYSDVNFRAFEWGNHLCEYHLDYTGESWPYYDVYTGKGNGWDEVDSNVFFPPKEVAARFLESYCKAAKGGVDATPAQLDHAYSVAWRGGEASHLLWGLWAILSSDKSAIDFGFLEYAISRLSMYFRMQRVRLGN